MNTSSHLAKKLSEASDPTSQILVTDAQAENQQPSSKPKTLNNNTGQQHDDNQDSKPSKLERSKTEKPKKSGKPPGPNKKPPPSGIPRANSVVPLKSSSNFSQPKETLESLAENQAINLKQSTEALGVIQEQAVDIEAGLPVVTTVAPTGQAVETKPPAKETSPAPRPKTFRDTMTWGERLLYWRCVRQLKAYREVLAEDSLESSTQAILQWISDTTFLLDHNSDTLMVNMEACTYANAVEDIDLSEACPEVLISTFAREMRIQLHSLLVRQIMAFRDRDPTNYKPTECYLRRIWPSIYYGPDADPAGQIEMGDRYKGKHLDTALGRDTSIRFLIFQLLVWMLVTLSRAAAGKTEPQAGVPLDSGPQICGLVAFWIVLACTAASCCANKVALWKYVFRGAWLGYTVWFAFATTVDELRYLVAPLILCIVMYVLNRLRIAVPGWLTYVIGVVFMLITFVLYWRLEAKTGKNLLLMFYLYNAWIAIHLDIVLSQLLKCIIKKEGRSPCYDVTKVEFMNWYIYSVNLMFHFLAPFIAGIVVGLCFMIFWGVYVFLWEIFRYIRACIPGRKEYVPDSNGHNLRKALEELRKEREEDKKIRAEVPVILAACIPVILYSLFLLTVIAICVMLPFKCLYTSRKVGHAKDPIDRLPVFKAKVLEIKNEIRAFVCDDQLAIQLASE